MDLDTAADRFYEAALVPECWPAVLDDVCTLFGSATGTLVFIGPSYQARGVASRTSNDALQQFLATPGVQTVRAPPPRWPRRRAASSASTTC